MRIRCIFLICGVVITASRSYAQALVPVGAARDAAGSSAWSERPVAIEAQLGVGAPLGFFGVAMDWSVIDWWSVGGGAGLNSRGLQIALMNRIRIVGSMTNALTLELGASRGNYKGKDFLSQIEGPLDESGMADPGSYSFQVDPAYWLYVGPGYDSRIDQSVLRIFGGFGLLLNGANRKCVVDGSNETVPCDDAARIYGTEHAGFLLFAALAGGYSL